MIDQRIDEIRRLYGDETKFIVADSELNILYSSCPNIFTELDKSMFSKTSWEPRDTPDFPITEKRVLTLQDNGVKYVATVRPIEDEGESYYCIEILDSRDVTQLLHYSPAGMAEMYMFSRLREATHNVNSGIQLTTEAFFRAGIYNKSGEECFQKGCDMIMSAIVNKDEYLHYLRNDLRPVCVDLSKYTESLCNYCIARLAYTARKIDITYDIEKGCHAVCDPDRYCSAIMNLFVNAVKYNISETREIHLSMKKAGKEVHITVSDNGVGMSLEEIEKAFVPYALCDIAQSGMGLGLPMIYEFGRTFGGSAAILSKLDSGTSVSVRIEAAGAEEKVSCTEHSYLNGRFSLTDLYIGQMKEAAL